MLNGIKDKEIREFCQNLKETLIFNQIYGLAAPQVGSNLRIIAVKAKKEEVTYNEPQDIPLTIMINPVWRPENQYDMEEVDKQYEACASVPSIAGIVERYKNIILEYYDEDGNKIEKKVSGFFARLVQHECDHLDGTIFLDWVDCGDFATKDMIKKYNLRKSKK